MHVRCPHCHSPIELADEQSLAEISCPSCGSNFSLIEGQATATTAWAPIRHVGHFDLVEQIGVGGFGSVWKARDTELDRLVAVKIPRKSQLDPNEIEQFLREARAAAQLHHPNIVSVHEVGRDADMVYIVSDLVQGVTLVDWLSGQHPTPRESAQLCLQLAEALEHAHQKGVVHRDIKPGNIMLDADGHVFLMDFGLAKREAGEITMTYEGRVLGTPAYMSPEQARGESHRVDRRTDIYSLGAVLFQLLTGELPFRGTPRMLMHQVLNEEPRSPRALNDRVPRDLETICLKAMAKDPARRYQSAQAMADDLSLYLTGQPITARPVGRIERSWRWCRRNPVVAGLSTCVVLALLLGTIVSGYFAVQADARATEALAEKSRADAKATEAEREREKALASQALEASQRQRAQEAEARAVEDARRAGIEAEKAQQVAKFMATIFEESAPLEMIGIRFGVTEKALASAALTAREILDRGAQRVTVGLQDQPEVQAALKETMGNVYLGMGLIEKADSLLQEALQTREQHLPRAHLDIASSLHSMAVLRLSQQRFAESADLLEEALEIRRKLLGPDDLSVDASRVGLAAILGLVYPREYSRDVPEAVGLWRESLAWRRGHYGNKHRETAFTMLGLAGALFEASANANLQVAENIEAAALVLEATPILLNDPTTKSLGLTVVHFQQAELMVRLGQNSAAVAAARRALATGHDGLDDSHPLMQIVKVAAAHYFVYGERIDEAEKIYQECISVALKRDFTLPSRLLGLMRQIAESLERRDPHRAEALYRQAIGMTRDSIARQRVRPARGKVDVSPFLNAVLAFGPMLARSGNYDEAEALYRESLPLAHEATDELLMVKLKSQLANLRFHQEEFDEAEALFRECLQGASDMPTTLPGFRDQLIGKLTVSLADCLDAHGKKESAEEMYRDVIKHKHATWSLKAEAGLARVLRDRGDDQEAIRLLRHVLSMHPQDEVADGAWLDEWSTLYELMKKQGADKPALLALIHEAGLNLAEARKRLGNEHRDIATLLVHMGDNLVDLAEFRRAEPLLREAIAIRQKALPADDPQQASARACLGECLLAMARYDEAEPLLLSGCSNLDTIVDPKRKVTVRAVRRLVRLYDAWQKPQKADEYRKLLPADDKASDASARSE